MEKKSMVIQWLEINKKSNGETQKAYPLFDKISPYVHETNNFVGTLIF